MQGIGKKTLLAVCALSFIFNFLQAISFEDRKKALMIQDLEVIKHHFEVGYAPADWKKEYADWDLNLAFEQSKSKILETPSITTKQFQQIVRDFVKTMKDYHVSVMFWSTERASLPFSVKGIEGRYFINWVDPLRLPPSYSGIRAGDELLEFGDRPIAEVIEDLDRQNGHSSNPQTDQGLTEMKLTVRVGFVGDDVPKGMIFVTTRSAKTGKVMTNQLRWMYTPEHVKNPLDFLERISFLPFQTKKPKIELPKITMANPLHQNYADKYTDRKGALGSRKSFLPLLGEVVWSIEDGLKKKNEVKKDEEVQSEKESEKECGKEGKKEGEEVPFWHAYIYQHPQGQKIGYIRIPHYYAGIDDINKFGEILSFMEEETDALVIDQLHNIGGFVHVTYALTSILTQKPLQTPYHRIKISQQDAMDAHQTIEIIKLIELMLKTKELSQDNKDGKDEKDKDGKDGEKKSSEEDLDGLNYQRILLLKDFCELILEDWNNGKTLTRPTPIEGVDRINPHPHHQYTKPILMLINEMDFSGGDFVPAILQDNKRAVLFGARTAGAGGYVNSFQFPNTHGIASCSYTASIAERTNLQKIENLGVTPDIEYQITVDDLLNDYRGYVEAVNQSIQALVEETIE